MVDVQEQPCASALRARKGLHFPARRDSTEKAQPVVITIDMDSTGTMGGSRLGPPAMPPSQMAGGLPQQTGEFPVSSSQRCCCVSSAVPSGSVQQHAAALLCQWRGQSELPPQTSRPVTSQQQHCTLFLLRLSPPCRAAVFIPSQPQQDGSGFGSQQKPVKGALNEPIPNIKGMEEREEGSFRRWLARANRPIVWRFLTFVLSAVAFCTMASARYCEFLPCLVFLVSAAAFHSLHCLRYALLPDASVPLILLLDCASKLFHSPVLGASLSSST